MVNEMFFQFLELSGTESTGRYKPDIQSDIYYNYYNKYQRVKMTVVSNCLAPVAQFEELVDMGIANISSIEFHKVETV